LRSARLIQELVNVVTQVFRRHRIVEAHLDGQRGVCDVHDAQSVLGPRAVGEISLHANVADRRVKPVIRGGPEKVRHPPRRGRIGHVVDAEVWAGVLPEIGRQQIAAVVGDGHVPGVAQGSRNRAEHGGKGPVRDVQDLDVAVVDVGLKQEVTPDVARVGGDRLEGAGVQTQIDGMNRIREGQFLDAAGPSGSEPAHEKAALPVDEESVAGVEGLCVRADEGDRRGKTGQVYDLETSRSIEDPAGTVRVVAPGLHVPEIEADLGGRDVAALHGIVGVGHVHEHRPGELAEEGVLAPSGRVPPDPRILVVRGEARVEDDPLRRLRRCGGGERDEDGCQGRERASHVPLLHESWPGDEGSGFRWAAGIPPARSPRPGDIPSYFTTVKGND